MPETAMQRGDEAPEAVLRLAVAVRGECFIAVHHVEAARRLARLFNRARLMQRTTMSYDAARIGNGRGQPVQADLADLTDSAIDARRLLDGLAARLPSDCWSVLIDICGFDKGLQQIEQERSWPRRSAKLVLRIGLDQLAAIMGLTEFAKGAARQDTRTWRPERAPMFAEDGI